MWQRLNFFACFRPAARKINVTFNSENSNQTKGIKSLQQTQNVHQYIFATYCCNPLFPPQII